MADDRHVRKYSKCDNSPTNGPTVMQLGWSHPIMFSTCLPWRGCHGNGRCWTFCSYGRLEAERMNQFRWNLVHNSTFGPQWQSRDQVLKFSKFKMMRFIPTPNSSSSFEVSAILAAMLENIENTITRLSMDQLGRNLVGPIPSRFRHVRYNAVAMATAVA